MGLRVAVNQSPIFCLSQDWSLGVLYTKIVCGLTMMSPDWWLKHSLEFVPGRYTSDELDVRFMGISNTCYRYDRTGSGSSLYRSSFYCPILRSQWTVQSSDWSASVPVVSDRNSSHGILCVAAETVQKVIRAHQE